MRPRRTMVLLGLLASAVFMYLAVRRLDFDTLGRVLLTVRLWPWVPLAVASYLLGHLLRGVRCRLLLKHEAALPVITASNVVVVGYAANNVFPARLGELLRAGMLSERTGIPAVQSLMITFIERVLDGLAILALLIVVSLGGHAPAWARDVEHAALAVFAVACVGLGSAVYAPGQLIAIASRLGIKLGPKWHDRIVGLATSVTNAGVSLRNPRDAGLLGVYSVGVWVLEAGMFVALLPALGLSASTAVGTLAMTLTNLGLLVPSSPGFIGPFHYICSRTLMAQGVEQTTALAYATVVHLTFYVPVTVWGALAMLWYGVEVGATAALARAAKHSARTTSAEDVLLHEIGPSAPVPRLGAPSAFTHALVEAMLAVPGVATEADALRHAVQFVHEELAALPPRLRVMLDSGLAFFRLVTRLRYFRGYCDLSLEARSAWTNAWCKSSLGLLRALMKPVRSCALLAYYDHPAVSRAFTEPLVGLTRLVREPAASLGEGGAES